MENGRFITRLYDVIVTGKSLDKMFVFLVQDYMENDMSALLKNIGNSDIILKDSHIKVLLYNLLCCLNFIHTSNVVHRDIKPNNILIDSNCRVKICDFGLARTIPNTVAQSGNLVKDMRQNLGREPTRREISDKLID